MNFDVSFCNSCSEKMARVFFKVSQGSVATYVKYDGKQDKSFIANFLLNSTVKEF